MKWRSMSMRATKHKHYTMDFFGSLLFCYTETMQQEKLDPELIRAHKGTSFVGVTTCFICYDSSGRIFMAQRSSNARDEQGTWDIGGGGLDWGLTAEDNAIKEIQEEYNATPLKIEFLGYRDVFRTLSDGRSTHWLSLDFAAKLDPGNTRINEPEKFDDSGWFTLDELPAPLHSQIARTLKKYEARLGELFTIKS
jgi:8-oxo-dGTP diphosphatase